MAGKEKHIVLIDDDITSLDIVAYLFEDKGFKVHRCADGFSAIDYVKKVTPDAVLVDLMMPGINGAETVAQIRALGMDKIPIIAFTAVDDPQLHSEAKLAGCNEVLVKPLHPEKLLQKVRMFLAD